jgi:photosystem II stability/assembly factor-like uncharacterized protein
MADDGHGWAAFRKGPDIYTGYFLGQTSDGGLTWRNVTPPMFRLYFSEFAIGFAARSADVAWAFPVCPSWNCLIDSPILWRTDDAGRSWRSEYLYAPGKIPYALQFVDDLHGWMRLLECGPMGHCAVSLVRTQDGGGTWETLPGYYLSEGGPTLRPFFFTARDGIRLHESGWLNGDYPQPAHLDRTADGGQTWQPVSLPLPSADLVTGTWGPGVSLEACGDFTNTLFGPDAGVITVHTGYRACRHDQVLPVHYISTDHGRTWNPLWRPGDTLLLDGQTGWRLTGQDSLEKTTDGGRTWLPMRPSWRIEQREGEAIIVHESGGGSARTEIRPFFIEADLWSGRELQLISLHMDSPSMGRAVAIGGASVCTQDGGRSWLPCQASPEGTLPAGMESAGLTGTWSPDGPLPPELQDRFEGGVPPARLQAALDDSRRLLAAHAPADPNLDEAGRQSWQKYYDAAFRFTCSSQKVDRMASGRMGVAQLCDISFPGSFQEDWHFENGGYFSEHHWYHYDYFLLGEGENRLWHNVVAADFLTLAIGWRQVDLQNGFFEIQKTTDGGSTWAKLTVVSWLAELDFVSAQEGWAIAWEPRRQLSGAVPDYYRDSALVHTTDGGQTWEMISPQVAAP